MGEKSNRNHDVFLSYSTKDKKWADAACAVLEHHRVRCWIAPRDITPGEEWGSSIIKGLNGSRIMVLIFSGHANASGQVRREVERAISQGMTVLPVRIEDVRPDGAMEYALGNRHWLDAFAPPVEQQMGKLARVGQTLLADDVEPEAATAPADPAAFASAKSRGGSRMTGDEPAKTNVDSTRWPPWNKWVIALTGSLLGLIALAVIIVAIRNQSGRETKTSGPDDSKVVLEGPRKNVEIKASVNGREKAGGATGPSSVPTGAGRPSFDKPTRPGPDDAGASAFVPLFNGRDLTGWYVEGGDASTWAVENGVIVARGQNSATRNYLLTELEYSDFVLRLEFKLEKGSGTGLSVRAIPGKNMPMPKGKRIFDHPLFKLMESRGREETGTTHWVRDSLDLKPDRSAELNPGSSWNRVEIEVTGHTMSATVNGKPILNTTLGPGAFFPDGTVPALNRASGKIGLQKHTGTVRFRRIEIRELKRP